jgi:endonuclease III related protein
MSSLDDALPAIREALTGRYGRPEPFVAGEDAFAALVAVALERAFDPAKQARAVDALRDAGLLDPQALAESDSTEAAEALRSAGLKVREKALAPLRRVARWLVELHHGDADVLAGSDSAVPTEQLREELAAVSGVGPATADALLLFALRRPVYPLDRATYRVLVRHGWIDATVEYVEARDAIERLAPDDPATLARLSHWFERIGRDYCRLAVAKCDKCPLRPWLPDGGPRDPNA